MIDLSFKLSNPWWNNRFDSGKWRAGETPFKHKFWEAQLMKTSTLLGFSFAFTSRCDHAGVRVNIGLLGYELDFNFYDNRHWNQETNNWYKYGEDEGWH